MTGALVDGVNAYHAAEFEVSFDVLRELLHLPWDATVLSVRDAPHGRGGFIIRIDHSDLPLVAFDEPTQINPTVTHERHTWTWGLT